MITIYGLGHSLIDIKWKEWKKEWWKILSIPNIILQFFITIFVGDIYIKFATGALILMMTIPLAITLIIIIFAIKDDLDKRRDAKNKQAPNKSLPKITKSKVIKNKPSNK